MKKKLTLLAVLILSAMSIKGSYSTRPILGIELAEPEAVSQALLNIRIDHTEEAAREIINAPPTQNTLQ